MHNFLLLRAQIHTCHVQVRQALLSWVQKTNTEQQMAPFLRNKSAQVIVAMVQVLNLSNPKHKVYTPNSCTARYAS